MKDRYTLTPDSPAFILSNIPSLVKDTFFVGKPLLLLLHPNLPSRLLWTRDDTIYDEQSI